MVVFVCTRRITRSMNTTPTASIPTATLQSTQPVIVHLEDDVPSLVPETTHMDEPILIENNCEKSLPKNITKLGKLWMLVVLALSHCL